MEKLLYNVSELPSDERSAVEAIIGHSLRDDQQLYIVALDAAVEPSMADRERIWNDLQAIITGAQQNVRDSGISPDELEQTVDQACNEVRYGS